MRIEVVSELEAIAGGLTEQLREAGFEVERVERETEKFELCVGKQVRIDEISGVLQALKPLLPSVRMVEDRDDDVIVFSCGADALLSQYNVKLYCDSNEFATLLRRDISQLGFGDSGVQVSRQDVNILKYGGATPAVRQLLRLGCADSNLPDACPPTGTDSGYLAQNSPRSGPLPSSRANRSSFTRLDRVERDPMSESMMRAPVVWRLCYWIDEVVRGRIPALAAMFNTGTLEHWARSYRVDPG